MSASERLGSLSIPQEFWIDSGEDARGIASLVAALPEIVAVVRAAEHVTFYGQPEYLFNEWHGSELLLSLAALDEKLGKDKP